MKLLLLFTSLFALGNMEQPLHVYTSEEIGLDELAKLDELGNTGNEKKKGRYHSIRATCVVKF